MNNLRKGLSVLVATAALSIGGVTVASTATASNHGSASAPCATQQTQLNRAQSKLDALTAKFAAESAKVKKDQRAVAATKGSAKARAEKALHAAKAEKATVAAAKKAQVQRVAHATAALNKCLATSSSAPAPSDSASA